MTEVFAGKHLVLGLSGGVACYKSAQLVRLLVTENLLRAKYLKKSSRIKGTLMPLMERASSVLAASSAALDSV